MPDDEYILRLRREIAFVDRNRIWLVLFQIALLAIVIWVFSQVVPVLLRFAQPVNAPAVFMGFIAGTGLGLSFGFMIHGILHGLISALSGGFRAERLLVQLLDSQYADESETQKDADRDYDFEEPQDRTW
jgi:uncharacterized membrane protein